MSYILELPPGPLPPDVNTPPYVLFGINGKECFAELPEKVPLKLVLHFVPKLEDWILPPPTDLPKEGVKIELLTPYRGIDIRHKDVSVTGLSWVVKRMLQLSGAPQPKEVFNVTTLSLRVCLLIYRTWHALRLPIAGVDGLRMHILMQLMSNEPVTLSVMKMIWASFLHKDEVVRQMFLNYMRSYLERGYTLAMSIEILSWILDTEERSQIFQELEKRYPEFKDKLRMDYNADKAAEASKNLANKDKDLMSDGIQGPMNVEPKQAEILEKTGTKKVTMKERKEREKEDGIALRRRLSRVKSDSSLRSIETAIWDPPTPFPASDKGAGDEKEGAESEKDALFAKQLADLLQPLSLSQKSNSSDENASG